MNVYHKTPIEKAFQFTPKDLIDNRQGILSNTQLSRLRRQATILALIIIGVMAVLGILTVLSAGASTDEVPLFLFCLGTPMLITLVATVGMTEMAVMPRVVSKRTGQIHLAVSPYGYNPPLDEESLTEFQPRRRGIGSLRLGRAGMYSMIVDDMEFRLSREEYQSLQPMVYTVYFVPTLKKIVALEPVPDAVPKPSAPETRLPPSFDDDEQDVLRA